MARTRRPTRQRQQVEASYSKEKITPPTTDRRPSEDEEGSGRSSASQELLGIRIEKLRGRILNRERINKTIEGVYFICASCRKVCHNVDDGLVEDPNNMNNLCTACATAKEPRGGKGGKAAAA